MTTRNLEDELFEDNNFEKQNHYDLNSKGLEFFEKKDYVNAINTFAKSLEQKEDQANIWYYYGIANAELKSKKEAVKGLRKATQLNPKDKIAWINRGFYESDDRTSLECYQKAAEIDPKYKLALNNIGIVANRLDMCYIAADAYDKLIQLDKYDKEAWKNKAHCYGSANEYDKESEVLEEYLRLFPGDTKTWDNLGRVYSIQGNHTKALRAYEKSGNFKEANQARYYIDLHKKFQ